MQASGVNASEKNSCFCAFVALFSSITVSLSMGISLTPLNSSAPAIRVFINETYIARYNVTVSQSQSTLILTVAQTALTIGALVGSLSVHLILSKFSRKGSIALTHILTLISVSMAPAAKLTPSYEFLIIGRFISGLSRGIAFAAMPVLIAETTCHRRLGMYQTPFLHIGFTGAALGSILGHYTILGTPELWPWLLCLPGIPALVYLVACPWLPQTPAYHFKANRPAEALQTLRKFRSGDDEDIKEEMERIESEIVEKSNIQAISVLELLRSYHFRKQFIAAMLVMNTPQLVGLQAIFFYSDSLFSSAGLPYEYVTYASAGLYTMSYLSAIVAFPLYRSIGFRKMFVLGTALILLSLILFIFSTATYKIAPVMPYVSVAAMCFYMFFLCVGPSFSFLGFTAELTTQTSRPTVMFYSGIMYWMVASAVSFILPYSVELVGPYAFSPFIVFAGIIVFYVHRYVPNTHRRSIAEIQVSFKRHPRLSQIELVAVSNLAFENK